MFVAIVRKTTPKATPSHFQVRQPSSTTLLSVTEGVADEKEIHILGNSRLYDIMREATGDLKFLAEEYLASEHIWYLY